MGKLPVVLAVLLLTGIPASVLRADNNRAAVELVSLPVGGADAADELGPHFCVHESGHFNIFHHDEPAWASQMATVLEQLRRRFYDHLAGHGLEPQPLKSPLIWIGFREPGDLHRYALTADRADLGWLDSYYSARTNRVAYAQRLTPASTNASMPGSLLTIDYTKVSHEAAHQLAYNCGLQRRGVMYPLWLTEGLATYFEISAAESTDEAFDNSLRRHDLLDAYRGQRMVSLDVFVSDTRVATNDADAMCDRYAQAWGLFSYLLRERPEGLRRYLEISGNISPGPRSRQSMTADFVAAFGSLEDVNRGWAAYLSQSDRLVAAMPRAVPVVMPLSTGP